MLSIWLEKPFPLDFALKHSLLLSLWYSLSTQVIGKSVCFRLERLSEDVGLYCVRGVWVCADGCVCVQTCVCECVQMGMCVDVRVWVCADESVCRRACVSNERKRTFKRRGNGNYKIGRQIFSSFQSSLPSFAFSLSLSLSLSLHNVCAHPPSRTHTHIIQHSPFPQ